MPLVDERPEFPKIPEQPTVVVAKREYESITVDTKYDPVSNLLTHVEGSSYTVQYYSQVLTKDSPLAGPLSSREAIHQQYIKIKDMELKVTTPLTYVQDDATKSIKGTGGATVYPMVIPNVGDVFVADMGDGNAGLFRITLSERKSIFKNTVHTIEYILLDTSANTDAFEARVSDMDSKVVNTVVYVRDFLQYGQNPLLQLSDYEIVRELADYYYSLTDSYFRSFVSNEYKTILIPGQLFPTYDNYLTSAIMKFFNTYDNPEIRTIRLLNVQDDAAMKAVNIWDVLKEKDIKLLKYSFRRSGIVTAMSFTSNPMLEGIYHSGIKFVVYPIDPQVSVDFQVYGIRKPIFEGGLQDTVSQIRDLSDLIANTDYEGLTKPENPLIHKVLVDDYYVLSEAFYNKDSANMSLLELCVMDYLENKAPNLRALLAICRAAHAWGGLERLYYVLVVLVLIKAAIRSL